jgi:predicted AlkP superfamily pyrophosphatase or phosphodiesterase
MCTGRCWRNHKSTDWSLVNADSGEIVVMIELDAFRFDYLDQHSTPFLWELSQKGISGRLQPTFGFEPDGAYLAGLYPDECDGGAQFWYDPENSPFRNLGSWTRILNLLPDFGQKVTRKGIEKLLGKANGSPVFSSARVPFHLLKYFSFPLATRIDRIRFSKGKTIFELLESQGKTWFFHAAPEYKVDIGSVKAQIASELLPPCPFGLIHVGDLDRVGHQYGPDSQERRSAAKKVDSGLKEIYGLLEERFLSVHFLLFGDHGMVKVKELLDVQKALGGLDLRVGKDYLVFLDSTMARFWFFTKDAGKIISETLLSLRGGHVLTQEERVKYHLQYGHNRFGDLIFLADPGVLIFPNFYQNKNPVKGMHGYMPEYSEQQSAFVLASPRVTERKECSTAVDMRCLYATVTDLLGFAQ